MKTIRIAITITRVLQMCLYSIHMLQKQVRVKVAKLIYKFARLFRKHIRLICIIVGKKSNRLFF